MWAEIDLDAIEVTFATLKQHLREGAEGHGRGEGERLRPRRPCASARAALAGGAKWLAVNIPDEGSSCATLASAPPSSSSAYIAPWEADKVSSIPSPPRSIPTSWRWPWRAPATTAACRCPYT